MKILFTSVGRRVELVQQFRHAAEKMEMPLTILGADISLTAPALAFCDRVLMICRISDTDYIPSLLSVCRREQIDAVIPTIDTDLLLLAENKAMFEALGTRVVISEKEKIAVCRDKRLTADYFEKCGLKSPRSTDDYKQYAGGFPCFIKPKDGSSSIDAYKVKDGKDLESLAPRVQDYIIQPFIDGTEYTVDIFCDFDGDPIYITPRKRVAVRSGEVIKTEVVQDERIISDCLRLIDEFKPCGAITVQLIRQRDTDEDFYIEINPRFGGGAPLSMKAGAESAEAMLKLLSGKEIDYTPCAACDGTLYSRFDQSVPVFSSGVVHTKIEAVVFDLDDTLYSEKEYVRSGFSCVAKCIPNIANAEEKLWDAFCCGKAAIDDVLRGSEYDNEEAKRLCITTYRNHTPSIRLYDGVAELISILQSRGIRTGILTDGRPEGQRSKIKALGLDNMVDEIIVTDELGGFAFRKPCDIAFRIMQKKLNVDFDNMLYVGDNLSKDFLAPRALGMMTCCLVNPDGLYGKSDGTVDIKVNGLREIMALLD